MVSNVYDVFENAAGQYPDRVALTFQDHRITYGEMKESTDRLAMGLKSLGLRPQDRIALMLPNIPHFAISYFALLKIGIAVVPVSTFFKSEEIHHQLEDSEVKGIIYWEGFRTSVVEAVHDLDTCEKLIVLGEKSAPEEIRLTYLMETQEPLEEIEDMEPNDTAVIGYTAGMSGRPKGAELTHGGLLSNIDACGEFLKLSAEDSVIAVIPFYHPIGLTLVMGAFLKSGGCVMILPKFNADTVLKKMVADKPTFFVGVPSMYQDFLKVEDDTIDVGSLKFCLSSGDALKEETMEAFESKFKVPILEGYGLTEATMVSFNSPSRERKAGSIGLPLPGVEIKIVSESGSEVRTGQVGEIIVQGPNVMKGYLNRPAATKEVIKDGWLYTGDLALLHENGFGYIVGRRKDVIVKSGFSVYPREVERYLYGHPKVKEAVVVGVPDPRQGEEIHACIVLKEGEEATQEEIIEYIKERIAAYKCPRIIHFTSDLPRGPTGRVMRVKVRESLASVKDE